MRLLMQKALQGGQICAPLPPHPQLCPRGAAGVTGALGCAGSRNAQVPCCLVWAGGWCLMKAEGMEATCLT